MPASQFGKISACSRGQGGPGNARDQVDGFAGGIWSAGCGAEARLHICRAQALPANALWRRSICGMTGHRRAAQADGLSLGFGEQLRRTARSFPSQDDCGQASRRRGRFFFFPPHGLGLKGLARRVCSDRNAFPQVGPEERFLWRSQLVSSANWEFGGAHRGFGFAPFLSIRFKPEAVCGFLGAGGSAH